jgi:hypothetical protein
MKLIFNRNCRYNFIKMKMVHGFLKFDFCLTVPHYRTWKSLAEVESSSISKNPEERKRQKGPFL